MLAYFPNLVLLSAFLGLGVGCLRAGRPSRAARWPAALLATTAVVAALGRVIFTARQPAEHLWLLYYDLKGHAPVVHSVALPIVVAFVASAISFEPLGQAVAERLALFQSRGRSLAGYARDIVGSLAGVVAFSLLGFSGLPPVWWFLVLAAAGTWLFGGGSRRALAWCGALALLAVAVVQAAERPAVYSPYYALQARSDPASSGVVVLANGSLHQVALPLKRADRAEGMSANAREGYHLPFSLMAHLPRRALVLGAGTGNDVATLLDEGVERIDAVEIDPEILRLGRALHPDRPYDSARVAVHTTDARSFLQTTRDTYDLIVFGTLDSMTRLSALSNVRLDNFVYTEEALRLAKSRLAPDGGLALYFMVSEKFIDNRLAALTGALFEQTPLVLDRHRELFNRVYLAGPLFDKEADARRRSFEESRQRILAGVELPSDDWPFLYLRDRSLSAFYLGIMALLAALAVVAVFAASPELRAGLRHGAGADAEMFLYGLGFLLLESRAVTAMSLLWGATWLTSSVVFGSVLLTVLAATLLGGWRPLSWRATQAGIVLSLAALYLLPVGRLVGLPVGAKLAASVLWTGAPVFFASLGFAIAFRTRRRASAAFGWNLLGAVAGGLLEFLSMSIGLRALILVALVAYLAAALAHLRRDSDQEPVTGALPEL